MYSVKDTDINVSLKTIKNAVEIMCQLDNLFIRNRRGGNLTNREIELTEVDCDKRIGEILFRAARNFGRDVVQTDVFAGCGASDAVT